MKTCISLYSYQKLVKSGAMTHYEAIDKIKELEMDAVELQINAELVPDGKNVSEYIKELCAYAKSIGLEVPILTINSNIYRQDPEVEIQRLCKMIDVAAECGIPLMRHDVTYSFLGTESCKTPKKIIEAVSPIIRRLADYARERGVKICSENHGRIMQDSDRMEELFYQVDHENYGLLCDMGNFGAADENCVRAVSRLLPQVCFVHAKDAFHRSGMMYDPGKGFRRTRGGIFAEQRFLVTGMFPRIKFCMPSKNPDTTAMFPLSLRGLRIP